MHTYSPPWYENKKVIKNYINQMVVFDTWKMTQIKHFIDDCPIKCCIDHCIEHCIGILSS